MSLQLGVLVGWVLAIACCSFAVFGYRLSNVIWDERISNSYLSNYGDLFTIGMAWVVFACSCGYGGR